MTRVLAIVLLLFVLAACCRTTAPETAVLVDGVWTVTLSDGRVCRLYYQIAYMNTPDQAFAACRSGDTRLAVPN